MLLPLAQNNPYTKVASLGMVYSDPGCPGGSVIKKSPANAGDLDSIPRPAKSLGGGHGNPLQCSCLENPMDRAAWWATVHGVTKESDTTEQLNNNNILICHRISGRTFPQQSLKPKASVAS